MQIRIFRHSLGVKGFELNFIGKVWNLRIASRQLALWKNHEPIFNWCRWSKSRRSPVVPIFVALLFIGTAGKAQLNLSNPFKVVEKTEPGNPFARVATSTPATLNTVKFNVSIPGYFYSNGKQQSAVVGMGLAFEHYKNDSLLYSLGPYLWYDSPIPTGSTSLPIGYGAAAGYKGLFLLGILTPDFVHWGPVISTNFSFGNGGIKFGGTTL
jgi:hypothetical protein